MKQRLPKIYFVSNYEGIKFNADSYRNKYGHLDDSRIYEEVYARNKGRRTQMKVLLRVNRDDVQLRVPQAIHLGRDWKEVLEVLEVMGNNGIQVISDNDLRDYQQGDMCEGLKIGTIARLLQDIRRLQTGPANKARSKKNRKGAGKPYGIRSKTPEQLMQAYRAFKSEDGRTVKEIMQEFGYGKSVSTFYRHMKRIEKNLNQ